MKKLPLSRNQFALIDDADFERVSRHKWSCDKNGYAVRMVGPKGKRRKVLLHRFLLNAPAGMDVDHISGDILDNRRCNLRLATRSQNNANSGPRKGKYKGVCWNRKNRRWHSEIRVNGKRMFLGAHHRAEDAAKAYDKAAHKAWGGIRLPELSERIESTGKRDC